MSFTKIRKMPSPEEVISMIEMPKELQEVKAKRDRELKDIFEGKDRRFIVIVGPCSADSEEPVCEYISRLAAVNEKVKDKLFIIPRIYTAKPRTTSEGYKGIFHQPDPEKSPNVLDGILALRRLHIRAIRESHLTAADEMLYPANLPYVEDMLGYIAVGARSVENQQHRLASSGIDVPVGMKNPTSGDLTIMFNSIKAAQACHEFVQNSYEVSTSGNHYAHAILRGSTNKHGNNLQNYHYEDLVLAADLYAKGPYKNPAIIVDANHANSGKKYREQPRIVTEILHSRNYNIILKNVVKGVMIESYLLEGNQPICHNYIHGKSITDACLGWEDTEKLLYKIAEEV
ncbi:MAG: 3-deoxy-7-phosphoheptulonate synthase [Clostridiales bacterium]|nr:3-deoxy-7-phosphoheptulonate synthase [Clostridiales bacterium]